MSGSSVLHYLPEFAFGLFILAFGFSRQEYWSGLPFPTPVDHVLSELFNYDDGHYPALYNAASMDSAVRA